MKLYLPNSANLQNIEGFIRKYSPEQPSRLQVSGHPKYIHVHPLVLAVAACAGASAAHAKRKVLGSIPNVSSAPYLVRMKLFDHLQISAPCKIEEHEESGRFIPLTQIRTADDLRQTITNLIPLLHAAQSVADPIKYVVSELGRNVLEHSQSPVGSFVCAQYYKDKKRIAIGMADAGSGIWNAIRNSHAAPTESRAVQLALTPGISGATPKIGGNETNAGAGLFFIRSIAKVSGNFFVLYSGNTLYKLSRKQSLPSLLYTDPFLESHRIASDLPYWQGTAVGIDINVDDTAEFSTLLEIIRKSYKIGVGDQYPVYMKRVKLFELVGSFAEDKDAAAKLRREVILPTLIAGGSIEIDFSGITLTTQSFIHALISQALRQEGEKALEKMKFKNCGSAARGITETVVQYVLESVAGEG